MAAKSLWLKGNFYNCVVPGGLSPLLSSMPVSWPRHRAALSSAVGVFKSVYWSGWCSVWTGEPGWNTEIRRGQDAFDDGSVERSTHFREDVQFSEHPECTHPPGSPNLVEVYCPFHITAFSAFALTGWPFFIIKMTNRWTEDNASFLCENWPGRRKM